MFAIDNSLKHCIAGVQININAKTTFFKHSALLELKCLNSGNTVNLEHVRRSRKMVLTHSMFNKCLLRAYCVLGSGEAVVSQTKSQLSSSVDVYEAGNVGQGCNGGDRL